LPMLLRDAQVFSIWEGTTNVLALDALRALGTAGLGPLMRETGFVLEGLREPTLVALSARIQAALEAAQAWLGTHAGRDETRLEAGARRLALTLGRCFAAALLARHAQWSLDHENDRRAHAAAARFAQNGLNLIGDPDPALSQLLVDDA
jgi:acyl-CoA dehydrogenase